MSKKDLFEVGISFASEQIVHCRINVIGGNMPFDLSAVYGLHSVAHRKTLWSQLEFCAITTPWLVCGDFNNMFDMDSKLGGNPINFSNISDGVNWLQNSFLEEVRCIGPRFSWSNRQEGNDRIYSKIDWVFCNELWHDAFNSCFTSYYEDPYSDHCFMLVKCIITEEYGFRPFRFFNIWCDHPNYKSVISSV